MRTAQFNLYTTERRVMNWYKRLVASNYQMYLREAVNDLGPIILEQLPTNLSKLKAKSASMANASDLSLQTKLVDVERFFRASFMNLKTTGDIMEAKSKLSQGMVILSGLCQQIKSLCQPSNDPNDPVVSLKENINNIKIWYDTLDQQKRSIAAGRNPSLKRQGNKA